MKRIDSRGLALTSAFRGKRRRGRIVLLVFLGALAAVGTAGGFFHKKQRPAPSAEAPLEKLGIERPEKVIEAPDFTVQDLSGRAISLSSLRGKVVFLNFWATWCGPCRLEMPTMEKLHREFGPQGLEVVAVNVREGEKEVRQFVQELGLTFTVLLDTDETVSADYGVWSIPLTYLIDRHGEFFGKVIGYRKWDSPEARAVFQGLLAGKPGSTDAAVKREIQ